MNVIVWSIVGGVNDQNRTVNIDWLKFFISRYDGTWEKGEGSCWILGWPAIELSF